jgi:hypothetical protein
MVNMISVNKNIVIARSEATKQSRKCVIPTEMSEERANAVEEAKHSQSAEYSHQCSIRLSANFQQISILRFACNDD